MKVYIDSNYRCHTANPDGLFRETNLAFDSLVSQAFIEGHRYVPQGESWTRSDGEVFAGEMFAPWKPISELDAAQREYERAQLADMKAALNLLGVVVDG